jgi:hypothetical protein
MLHRDAPTWLSVPYLRDVGQVLVDGGDRAVSPRRLAEQAKVAASVAAIGCRSGHSSQASAMAAWL